MLEKSCGHLPITCKNRPTSNFRLAFSFGACHKSVTKEGNKLRACMSSEITSLPLPRISNSSDSAQVLLKMTERLREITLLPPVAAAFIPWSVAGGTGARSTAPLRETSQESGLSTALQRILPKTRSTEVTEQISHRSMGHGHDSWKRGYHHSSEHHSSVQGCWTWPCGR